MMNASRTLLLMALALPGLASAQAPQLVGTFKWTLLDGEPAPQTAPDGKTTILASTMQLDDSTSAGRRFKLSFTFRVPPSDSAVTASHAGRFRFTRDSLFFTNDGQEARPPVRFKYAWTSDNRVALTDIQGHVWVYVK